MIRLLAVVLISVSMMFACKTVKPDADQGPIFDASQNIATARYFPVVRQDNPTPVETQVFIRHFYYFTGNTPWTIISSGGLGPNTKFEESWMYVLRLRNNEGPVRLLNIPGLQTNGVASPRVQLAISAPSDAVIDGIPLVRNTNGNALVYVENGPLYGGFTVDISDTLTVSDQRPRLLVDARVRSAALAFDGTTVAFVDQAGRLYLIDTLDLSNMELLVDLRETLGSTEVSAIQWQIGSTDVLILRINRGRGTESWGVNVPDRQVFPSVIDPDTIQEPGADRLPLIDSLTRDLPAGVWRVPAPQRFE